MSTNVIEFKSKQKQLDPNDLVKLLESLREKERLMVNPLLKDWFAIKSQIRKIERTIGSLHANDQSR